MAILHDEVFQLFLASWIMLVIFAGHHVGCCPSMCFCSQPDEEHFFNHYYTACDNLGWMDVPETIEYKTTDLSLAGNQLYSLSYETMSKASKVRALYLQSNRFTNIDEETVRVFTTLPSLDAVDLSDNPWNCSCSVAMVQFVGWLESVRGPRPSGDHKHWVALVNGHRSTCATPQALAGKRLDRLKKADICS